ncbi:MAG TPA: flavodoxin domain-containing protein, partial [Caldimonas sp.]|nr:flavodoxin domain-containing protein [Caldimonas sp.]
MNAPERFVADPPVVALLPDDAPFTPSQRAWLDGFFAALLSRIASGPSGIADAGTMAPAPRLHVVFATQTGTAEGLAKKLAKEAKVKGFDARAHDLGALSLAQFAALGHVVAIASTHGEGDPPDAVGAFVGELDAAPAGALAGLSYSVLALGDRNYAKFCGFGRFLDDRLAALGATRIAPRIDADADVAEPFARFRAALWPALPAIGRAVAMIAAQTPAATEAATDDNGAPAWSRDRPFAARLRSKDRLSGAGSDKEVRHVVLSLAGSGLAYEPGDALGVRPRQSAALVDAVLDATALAADATV